MKFFSPLRSLALAAGFALAAPAASQARHITYYQDRDHDGHYVKKTIDVGHGGYRGGYYGGGYRYGGYPYYRPYGYGYGYGYGYPYSRPGLSFSYYGGGGGRDYDYDSSDSLSVDVQRALKRRGYYGGSVDGDIGPGTRGALRRYQYEHRLEPTGRIDRDTVRALGL